MTEARAGAPRQPAAGAGFAVGDRVRVKADNPAGTPRTPRYIRGRCGVIVAARGVTDNPLDHAGLYPPLYTVMFAVRDVFGGDADGTLCVDIHEDWLERPPT